MYSGKVLMMYSLMFGAALQMKEEPLTQRPRGNKFDRYKNYTNIVIERLVSTGSCYIEDQFFERLYEALPKKLRGEVRFHSDIESKRIFITYTRYKP